MYTKSDDVKVAVFVKYLSKVWTYHFYFKKSLDWEYAKKACRKEEGHSGFPPSGKVGEKFIFLESQ